MIKDIHKHLNMHQSLKN